MTDKHFQAILSKNFIARELAINPTDPAIRFILARLKDIELHIGEGNQPSAMDTYQNANRSL